MFDAGRFSWCLFIGHLVLEKALKANYVKANNNKIPPKIHNLLRLADESNIELTPEQARLFADVNRFNMEGRYAEFKNQLYKIATKEFTEEMITKIKENF